ncbi:TIGR03752 family integrating conjugative element protein [Pseudomonas synxantha]|uniref:Integrating conjugative element protein (TIGR03752 family) n=1 Tax=Pseudomonas synxantha TaxID=47883 RepID=A0ACC6JRP3_9PSED|nr:TIGR03752 family integrating conjugative element protein [Pseudomonas synxantha]MDR6609058.1 integrating conjugative element protein (TIGR03752 family) [Pseudomonas synxantha]
MKSNGLLKWLMIPMGLLLVVVLLKMLPSNKPSASSSSDTESQLTPEEMKALGFEGDTPSDTVATLVAQVKQLRGELKKSIADDQKQDGETAQLRHLEDTVEQRIQDALETERHRLQEERATTDNGQLETHGLLQELQQRLDSLSQRENDLDLPVGLGLQEGDGKGFGNRTRWIEPDDAKPNANTVSSQENGFSFPTQFGPAQRTLDNVAGAVATVSGSSELSTAKAVYTVPSNATLMGSVAMTALIGRVPIDGTVNDPYPFKVLIGADNLTANGIDLPEVSGAVVSGTASGDWTLSCVRGQIRSITFVFQDGTIRTIPGGIGSQDSSQSSTNSGTTQEGLGWISDSHGIPCVSGERRSNAQQYLGSQTLITAAGAGAASLIKSDRSTTYVSNGNGSQESVGISGNAAMERILSSGVQDMSQWVNKLYGQAFAAIYVEPGAQVAVHLEQSLTLDYDAKGRKVDHTLGGRHAAPDLD